MIGKNRSGGNMSQFSKKPPAPVERSQTPLWFAIGGLLVSLASFGTQDTESMQIGDVIFWTGVVIVAISLVYYFFSPTHGIRSKGK